MENMIRTNPALTDSHGDHGSTLATTQIPAGMYSRSPKVIYVILTTKTTFVTHHAHIWKHKQWRNALLILTPTSTCD